MVNRRDPYGRTDRDAAMLLMHERRVLDAVAEGASEVELITHIRALETVARQPLARRIDELDGLYMVVRMAVDEAEHKAYGTEPRTRQRPFSMAGQMDRLVARLRRIRG